MRIVSGGTPVAMRDVGCLHDSIEPAPVTASAVARARGVKLGNPS
jgi:hypothetical protein